MPTITLTFNNPLNVSVQRGDTAYYCNTVDLGQHRTGITDNISAPNFNINATGSRGVGGDVDNVGSDIIQIGPIVDLERWNGTTSFIDCDWQPVPSTASPPLPNPPSFIMFSKDNKANLSTILGYYADVEFRNNSTNEAELFSVGSNIFESSK